MSWCETCRKSLRGSDDEHAFSGYGFRVVYCLEHCPGECDGVPCRHDVTHPNPEAERERLAAWADWNAG